MQQALIGLLGVIVGGIIAVAKDVFLVRRRESKDMQYLCVQVVSALERFSEGCVDVVQDHGVDHPDGTTVPGSSLPDFEPHGLDVQWHSLPVPVLYRVLDLPNKVRLARRVIDGVIEYVAGPPDYSEFFEERQYQCAKLGLEALDLAFCLRRRAGLPRPDFSDWNPIEYLRSKEKQVRESRASVELTNY